MSSPSRPPDWLRGSLAVVPTPLTDEQDLDTGALGELTGRLRGHGAAGVVVLGSTGEGAYLTGDERDRVVAAAADSDLRVVAGVMRFGTRQTVEEARRAVDAGADGLLVNVPQYYPTPFDRVVAHFEAVTDAVDVPVLYYHYPAVTGLRLSASEIGELFARVPLAGTKETGLSTPELRSHLEAIDRPVSVFTGQSFDLLDTLDAGGVGAISPVSLLLPRTERELIDAFEAGDRPRAESAQRRLFAALPLISPVPVPLPVARVAIRAILRFGLPQPVGEGVPHAAMKEALVARGLLRSAAVRDPQPGLSDAQRRRVRRRARVIEL